MECIHSVRCFQVIEIFMMHFQPKSLALLQVLWPWCLSQTQNGKRDEKRFQKGRAKRAHCVWRWRTASVCCALNHSLWPILDLVKSLFFFLFHLLYTWNWILIGHQALAKIIAVMSLLLKSHEMVGWLSVIFLATGFSSPSYFSSCIFQNNFRTCSLSDCCLILSILIG